MRFALTHDTRYRYTAPVSLSHHVVRLAPRNLPAQRAIEHQLHIDPAPSVISHHTDYFGNTVYVFTMEQAHAELLIRSTSMVEVQRPHLPNPEETTAWESVRDYCRGCQSGSALDASEFVHDSPLIATHERYRDYALISFRSGRPILSATLDLTRRIHEEFRFDPAATTIATPVEEVYRARRGVCQDFAQLQIACLRSLGLPARYVSGYLETDPPPGRPRLAGADASHAWVGVYCHGIGWIDVDPTNNLMPTTRHITVAWGRDFSDVSPVRGVVLGGGAHSLEVGVDVLAQG